MNVRKPDPIYDVVVIGSGAAGGMAAWNLTRQGINVLVLDAGQRFDRAKFWSHVKPWQANARHERGEHAPEFYLSTKEQPYRTPDDKPFELTRVWGRGGKTNVWGRVSLRYSDLDFQGPAPMVGRCHGRSATETSLLTTTKWINLSESAAG